MRSPVLHPTWSQASQQLMNPYTIRSGSRLKPSLLALAPILANLAAAQPQIEFDSVSFDSQPTYSGAILEHSFTYTNKGDGDLIIQGVDVSCGCTTVGKWEATLKPGEKSSIKVKFDTVNMTGPQIKSATVRSNDLKQPSVQLLLKVDLASTLELQAPHPNIVEVPMATAHSTPFVKTFAIHNHAKRKINFGEPTVTNAKNFKVTVKSQESGTDYDFVFETIPPYPGGGVLTEFSIPTSLPEMPELRGSLIIIGKPVLSAEPSGIMVDRKSKEAQNEFSIILCNSSDGPISLLSPKSDAAELKLNLESVREGFEYRLRVSNVDKVAKRLEAASLFIRIATNSQVQPELIIPISAID